jgi:hypothetical protein
MKGLGRHKDSPSLSRMLKKSLQCGAASHIFTLAPISQLPVGNVEVRGMCIRDGFLTE